MPGRPHVSISTQNTWNLHLFIAYGLNLILWGHGSHIHHNVSSWIVPPWQILILCWSVQVHSRLSIFLRAQQKRGQSRAHKAIKARDDCSTAARPLTPAAAVLQCRPAQQTSWAAKLKTDHFLNQNAYGVGYFLSELHNHVQNLWNLYPFLILRQCQCWNETCCYGNGYSPNIFL